MHVLYEKNHGGLLSLTISGVCCLWDVCHQPISDHRKKKKEEGLLAANVPQLDEEGKKKRMGGRITCKLILPVQVLSFCWIARAWCVRVHHHL